jgi:hypothetical protein
MLSFLDFKASIISAMQQTENKENKHEEKVMTGLSRQTDTRYMRSNIEDRRRHHQSPPMQAHAQAKANKREMVKAQHSTAPVPTSQHAKRVLMSSSRNPKSTHSNTNSPPHPLKNN